LSPDHHLEIATVGLSGVRDRLMDLEAVSAELIVYTHSVPAELAFAVHADGRSLNVGLLFE